jgi:putative transposase
VKLHLTEPQKALFQTCLQHHRFFYNKAVEAINNRYIKRLEEFRNGKDCVHCSEPRQEDSFCCSKHQSKALPWKLNIALPSLRSEVLKSDEEVKENPKLSWQTKSPYDTRQLAIKDAVSAYKAAVTNKMRGNIQQFKMGYKSRRNPSQIFWVDSAAIKKVKKVAPKTKKGKKSQPTSQKFWLRFFPKRLGVNQYVRVSKRQMKKLPDTFSDCKVQKYGKTYYLLYTFEKDIVPREARETLLSLDPGVRTFQTGYSPSGMALKCGERQSEHLGRLHARLDAMRSKRDKATQKAKQRLRSSCLALETRIFGVVENLHNQVASFLSKEYGTLLLPKFCTSVMQKGALASGTKRDLWTLSHYKFQQKLLGLCMQNNCTLYIVEEHYTTKTCGSCGSLMNVGSAKTFSCTACPYKLDRDIHGARNILLKHITQFGA